MKKKTGIILAGVVSFICGYLLGRFMSEEENYDWLDPSESATWYDRYKEKEGLS